MSTTATSGRMRRISSTSRSTGRSRLPGSSYQRATLSPTARSDGISSTRSSSLAHVPTSSGRLPPYASTVSCPGRSSPPATTRQAPACAKPAPGASGKKSTLATGLIMMERVDLAVELRGSGRQTLLLLHGLGASRDHFDEVADALDRRFRIVLPDLRGHGDSPAAPVERIEDYVGDLVPILREHGPLALCGLSFGGDLGLHLWQALPEAIAAIAVVDPLLDPQGLWEWARCRATTDREAYREIVSPFYERDVE